MVGQTEQVLTEYVRKYRRLLFSVAFAWTGKVDVADDIVQTLLLRLASRDDLTRIGDAEAYLVTAVTNLCRNRFRRERVVESLPEDRAAAVTAPDEEVALRELGDLLRATIRALPSAYRIPVWLVHVEGLRPADVARVTGKRPVSVKSALARGRRLLRERLGPLLRKAGYLEM